MTLPAVEPYVETFFWLTSTWKENVPSGYVRRNDIVRWLTEQIMTATERFGPSICRPYSHLCGDIFDKMVAEGFVAIETNEVSGSYYCIDGNSLSGFRNARLQDNPINKQYNVVGTRLFDDVFDVYSQHEASEDEKVAEDDSAAPAADRIVRFDHNQPDAEEISKALSQVYEDVRGANDPDIDEENRHRVIAGVEGAISLWNAGQFKLIQLKVGILLAVEEAERLLVGTAKAVGIGLIVDAIKAFAKNRFNADLDLL